MTVLPAGEPSLFPTHPICYCGHKAQTDRTCYRCKKITCEACWQAGGGWCEPCVRETRQAKV